MIGIPSSSKSCPIYDANPTLNVAGNDIILWGKLLIDQVFTGLDLRISKRKMILLYTHDYRDCARPHKGKLNDQKPVNMANSGGRSVRKAIYDVRCAPLWILFRVMENQIQVVSNSKSCEPNALLMGKARDAAILSGVFVTTTMTRHPLFEF